jgi:hypothetical protein
MKVHGWLTTPSPRVYSSAIHHIVHIAFTHKPPVPPIVTGPQHKRHRGAKQSSLLSQSLSILLCYFHSLLSINIPLRFLYDSARVLFELPRTNGSFEDLI